MNDLRISTHVCNSNRIKMSRMILPYYITFITVLPVHSSVVVVVAVNGWLVGRGEDVCVN